jgi:hypothetical protein
MIDVCNQFVLCLPVDWTAIVVLRHGNFKIGKQCSMESKEMVHIDDIQGLLDIIESEAVHFPTVCVESLGKILLAEVSSSYEIFQMPHGK